MWSQPLHPWATSSLAVGGDRVEVTVLVPPGAEPHTYEPTPSQMKDVAKADLYVMNGAGLEFWMDKVLGVNKKMVVIDSSEGAVISSRERRRDRPAHLDLVEKRGRAGK